MVGATGNYSLLAIDTLYTVDNDSHAAYVYAPDDSDALYFVQKLRQLGILYRDFTIDGYHVYLPARRLYPGFPGWDT